MITNKDLSIDSENGKIVLNGDKYDLGTQGEIDTAVKDVYSVMGQMGAKNLIPYPYYEKTHVDNGITWTDNGDGTVTANGTATATSYFLSTSRTLVTNMADSLIEGERYILTGCPTGGSNQKYDVFINETYNGAEVGLAFDYGNGATFTLDHKTDNNYGVGIRIRSGQTVSNLTFKPMLRLASDTDNTYEPYAMTNKQLTEQVADVKGTIGDITQTGITGASVADQLSNIGVKATWTPKIYDNQTYKRDVAGNQYYIKIGNLYIMFIEGTLDYSEITTVLVIGNLPCTTCIGGTVYLGGLVQGSIGVVGNTIQGVENRAVLRPNVVSTDFATPTTAPNNRFVLFGID